MGKQAGKHGTERNGTEEEETCRPQMSKRNDAISEALLCFSIPRTMRMIDQIVMVLPRRLAFSLYDSGNGEDGEDD